MKEILASAVSDAVFSLFSEACLCPPEEVTEAFCAARETEPSETGREVLGQLIKNAETARKENVPYCQDTGMAVVLADIGQDVHISGDFNAAVNEGVRRAYTECFYRKSVLTALSRKNTGDNTPAVVHVRLVPGDSLKLTALPKGFGSENMSKIAMLPPSAGRAGIVDFIVGTAKAASANPCPPVFLGVGIGGTFEYAALMAKRQLARPFSSINPDPALRELEEELCDRINALGMGPMALGGRCYCLKVCIEEYPTHIAGLPVAVNYCCHAVRHSSVTL